MANVIFVPVMHSTAEGTQECTVLLADQSRTLCGLDFEDLIRPPDAFPRRYRCEVCKALAIPEPGVDAEPVFLLADELEPGDTVASTTDLSRFRVLDALHLDGRTWVTTDAVCRLLDDEDSFELLARLS